MRVFVTGATGFIGSAIVPELLDAGHRVLGLARSDAAAAALQAAGADVQRGSLDDLDSLRGGASASDGVIHAGFIHEFNDYARCCETDRRAVETLGEALAGSGRPLVVTSGTALVHPGRTATEGDAADADPGVATRAASERATLALAGRGVRAMVLRLPPSVHGDGDHGFVPALIQIARARGVSASIGDGSNRWPAVHRLDAARLYRLALEGGDAGARYHAVADEGVPTREIAEVVGRRLNLPVASIPAPEAAGHFGWLGPFFAIDNPTSSVLTRARLSWTPTGPSLLSDLDHERYFRA